MNYKIKRFLKRNFKRILRCIIIFGIFSCFTVYSFAQSFSDFSNFMAGANSYGYVIDQDGYTSDNDTIVIEDMGYYDRFLIRSPGAGYGDLLDEIWFGGVQLAYTNGVNFSVSYSKGDYILLSHQIYIATYKEEWELGMLGDFTLDLNSTSIVVSSENEYGGTESSTYSGKQFVKSITYDEWYDEYNRQYKSMLIDIYLKQPLPSNGNKIYALYYNFPKMFTGASLYFDMQPSNSSTVLFDVGDPSSMATFPDFSGNPTLEEEEQLTQELRQQAFNAAIGGFATIGNNATNFLNFPFVYKGIVGASNLIDDILGTTFLRNLLWVSLSLGLSVFILNIGVSSIVKLANRNKE